MNKERFRRFAQISGRFVLRSSVPEVLFIATLILAKYLPNSDFSYPSEVLLPVVLFGVFGTGLFYLYKKVFKDALAAHISAFLVLYGCYAYQYGYGAFHKLVDLITPYGITPFTRAGIFLFVIIGIFGLLGLVFKEAYKRESLVLGVPLLKISVFIICFMFAVQAFKTTQRLWTIRDQLGYSYPVATIEAAKQTSKTKPNIYYLVLDRYASNETLERQYSYDNSGWTNFLSDQGFVTRQNAYSNYPFTPQSVSSTLAMDYLTDLGKRFKDDAPGFQTGFPYRSILDNPPIAKELQQHGYAYNQVSSWWDFTRNSPTANTEPTRSFRLRVFGKAFWQTDFQRDIINKSILSPLLLKGMTFGNKTIIKYDLDNDPRMNFEAQMAALKQLAGAGSKQPQFTFAHILSPHDPYVFTETGEKPTYGPDRTDDGLDESQKYTKQLTYVNGRFKDLIRTIRTKDKNAIVIIQADEGPYPKEFRGALSPKHYFDPINLPVDTMQQKFGIQASYYMPGMTTQQVAEGIDSSVNVFRFVLNNYLGYSLELLPDCQFAAGNKYYMFRYQLVSDKLKHTTQSKECAEY